MNIYRKIYVVFSSTKQLAGLTFVKKIEKNEQVSIIHVNQKRSNAYNQSIENKMITQNILVKSKMHFL